jgi:hypothetical protein
MSRFVRLTLPYLMAASGLAAAGSALAAGDIPCDGVLQDRAACVRERGAARDEARRGGLTSAAPTTYEQNALARCGLQPSTEQAACEARVRGTGMTTYDGSVLGGGVVRETVTPVTPPLR